MGTIGRMGLFSLLLLFLSCVSSRHEKNEMRVSENFVERFVRDSIFVCDSVRVVQKCDTVFLERVRTLFRDKIRLDTVVLRDTVYKEKVVTKEKRVGSFSFWGWLPALFLVFVVGRVLVGWRK